jgi:hypothetical protein
MVLGFTTTYAISGKTNTWIQNFLSDRSEAVVVDREKSSYIDVDSGVPQGSDAKTKTETLNTQI